MENITTTIISMTALITALCSLVVAYKKIKKELEEAIPRKIKRQSSIDIEIIKKME